MKEKRDMSRTDLARMVTNLRKELKEQIKENQELEKKVDGLVTVIDLVREYINKHLEEHVIEDHPDEQSIFYDEKGWYIPNAKEQLLEILERVNEE